MHPRGVHSGERAAARSNKHAHTALLQVLAADPSRGGRGLAGVEGEASKEKADFFFVEFILFLQAREPPYDDRAQAAFPWMR